MTQAEAATIRYHDQTWQVDSGMTIHKAIEHVGLDPLSVLAIRGKKLTNNQTVVEPADEIRLVDVISGG
jgi:sulfur carrier protein ThiS